MSRPKTPGLGHTTRRALGAALTLSMALTLACGSNLTSQIDQVKEMHEAGQLAESHALLETILEEHPNDPQANFLMGLTLVSQLKGPLAVWPLRKAAASDDTETAVDAGILLSNLLIGTDDYEEGVKAAQGVLDREPDNIRALVLRAAGNAELNDHEAAVRDARRVLELEPERYEAYHIQTTSLAELERFDEAEASLRRQHELARDRDPGDAAQTCVGIASFLNEFRDDKDGARTQIQKCLDDYADNPLVVEWAVSLSDEAGDTEAGNEVLAQATSRHPDQLAFWEQRAQRLIHQDRGDDARALLEEAAGLLDTPDAWKLLADFLRVAGDLEGALSALDNGLAVASRDPESLSLLKADTLVQLDRTDEARTLADAFERPAFRHFVEGRIHQEEGDPRAALDAYEKGIALWPNNTTARYNAGLLATELGDVTRALSHYREASRTEPNKTDAALRMAELMIQTGEYSAANKLAIRHAKNRPMDAGLYLVGARAALKAGFIEDARGIYEEMVRDTAGLHLDATLGLAEVALAESGPGAAAKAIEEAELDWADAKNNPALRAWVQYLTDAGDPQAAAERIEAAIAAQGGPSADLLDVQGRTLMRLGETDAARAAFGKAISLDPQFGPAIAGLATLDAVAGQRDEAIAGFDRAVAAETPDADAGYLAAQLVLASGNKEDAERRLRAVLAARPGLANAANDLAWLLTDAGRESEYAVELAMRATRVQPAPHTWGTLGMAQLANDQPRQAMSSLEKSLQLRDNPSTRYRLALAQEAAGLGERALETLERALETPDFPEAQDAETRRTALRASLANAE